MIAEINHLKAELDFEHEIILKMVRYDYETHIHKDDIIKPLNDKLLRIIRPSGATCTINTDYVMVAFISRRVMW